jgi:small subunit ribosomal protein S2
MAKKKENKYLVDLDLYIKTRIYVAHKIVTCDMRPYVYRRKADGVAVFNTDLVDQKIREAIQLLSKFKPEEVIVVGKKQQARKILEKFSELTGIKVFTKKYPAGILTNISLPNFMEPKLVIIVDPLADKNCLHDANIARIPVLALCNSNHYTKGIDFVLPINNKDESSLGLFFYLLAKGYLEALGIKKEVKLEDFVDLKSLG